MTALIPHGDGRQGRASAARLGRGASSSSGRARSCSPPAASRPTRRRAMYLGPNWDVAKVRGTPYNTGEVLQLRARRRRAAATATGAAATRSPWDAAAPPTGDRELTNLLSKQSLSAGIVVNRDGERFLDEGADFRNYTYAKYGAEILKPAGRGRLPALRRQDRAAAAQGRVRLARRLPRRRPRRVAELADALGHRSRPARPHGQRVQRRRRRRPVRPRGQGRQAHARHRAAEVELGTAARRAALPWLRRHLRDHFHLRRRARRRPTPACSTAAASRSPACTRPASSSAACSSTTTPAARG